MRILVTGGTGFIGAHLVRSLVQAGHQVVVLDHAPNPAALQSIDQASVEVVAGSVVDPHTVAAAINNFGVQRIVHLAYVLPPASEEDPRLAIEVNCVGTTNIFEAALKAGVERVVWTSSMAVYGSAEIYAGAVVDEESPVRPSTVYGGCKVAMERVADRYVARGLDLVGLRFNLVYGPGRLRGVDIFKLWTRDMFEAAATGQPLKIPSADQFVDWIFVADVVKALELALRVERLPHRIYNVLGERRPIRDAVTYIKEVVVDADLTAEPGTLPSASQFPAFAGDRARRDLGFEPGFPLRSGVRAYLSALQDASRPLVQRP